MKELVQDGQLKEVGRREVALLAVHAGMTRHAANFKISSLGGIPYSMKDYAEIQAIPKSDISKKQGNFDKLRAWMNDSLPFHYLRVGDGENLLAFARLIEM